MSLLTIDATEKKAIDSKVEQMMDWAKVRQAEAEQLAQDSTRLLACTSERMDRLTNQNFFIRCWRCFNGDAASAERANINDLIQMQKIAFRYVDMLQEEQLLTAHSLLTLKNNLLSLAVSERQTKELIIKLADRTRERFERLEGRVDQLEISSNLHSWIICLEERDYDKRYPENFVRLFQVINDFYEIKKGNWNYSDILMLRKAIRIVGIDPIENTSLHQIVDNLIDEIQDKDSVFDTFRTLLERFKPQGINDYSKYAVDNISSPIFVAIHGLKIRYLDKSEIIKLLKGDLKCDTITALKRLLLKDIEDMNVNLGYQITKVEAIAEILNCIDLLARLYAGEEEIPETNIPTGDHSEPQEIEEYNPILAFLKFSSEPRKRLYIAGQNNDPELEKAAQVFMEKNKFRISLQDIVIFNDTSSKKSFFEGFALTKNTLYVSYNKDIPRAIEISEITEIKGAEPRSGLQIVVQGKEYYIPCSSSKIASALSEAIKKCNRAELN